MNTMRGIQCFCQVLMKLVLVSVELICLRLFLSPIKFGKKNLTMSFELSCSSFDTMF